ncbi:MAG: hypothetical protein U1B83_08480, partial [Candidatus Cloacimonadaceae bacterium]|nr:hypothetical protein [Candidatus Cloacimonadaceae bacterium]
MTSRNRLLTLVVMLAALMLVSCQNPFRPPLIDNSNDQIRNRTPVEVLQNLERSYRERNINIYKSVLAPDFRFELISSEVSQIGVDINGDGIRDSWWGFDEEVAYTTNLFVNGSSDGLYPPPDELSLRLQIPPEENWENDPEIGHENWIVIPCMFNLTLTYHASNSSIAASGVARFYL